MDMYGEYRFEFGLFLVDENYHSLTGANFQVKNYNKTKTLNMNVSSREDKAYIFSMDRTQITNGIDLLPPGYQQIFNGLHTRSDVESIQNIDYFYVPFRIIETNAPEGYKNEEILFFAQCFPTFHYDSNNNITSIEIGITTDYESTFMTKDDSNLDYTHLLTYDELNENENRVARTCGYEGNIYYGQVVTTTENIWGSGCYEVMYYFINQKGTASLKITNTVNNVLSYNATNNKKLTYNINVSNIGEVASTNNVIITNVPEGIEVDITTISDHGTYNKTNNTITWSLNSLGPEQTYTFTYEATVPESALSTNEYIGNSYVMSDQVTNEIKSENTVVNLSNMINTPDQVNNPSTGVSNMTSLFLLIGLVMVVLFTIWKKKDYLK